MKQGSQLGSIRLRAEEEGFDVRRKRNAYTWAREK